MEYVRKALFPENEEEPVHVVVDTMRVCEDGHVITDDVEMSPHLDAKFCAFDNKATLTTCPNEQCRAPIPGKSHYQSGYVEDPPPPVPPEYCRECRGPFPWTGRTAVSARPTDDAALIRLFDRFDLVARQLRKPERSSVQALDLRNEFDVQHLLHSLLHLYFDDIRPEEWVPSYAGKPARMDFLLKREKCVVETKMSRPTLTHKEIGDELLIDIARYQTHQDCKKLFCFVYDPATHIANPRGIEADLTKKHGDLDVRVIIRP